MTAENILTNAVTVESKVEVKWDGMGTLFATAASSAQQAAFLTSMVNEMKTWPIHVRQAQMLAIADCLYYDTKRALENLFPLLWDE